MSEINMPWCVECGAEIERECICKERLQANQKLVDLANYIKANEIAFVVPADKDRVISVCIGSGKDEEIFSFTEEFTHIDVFGFSLY